MIWQHYLKERRAEFDAHYNTTIHECFPEPSARQKAVAAATAAHEEREKGRSKGKDKFLNRLFRTPSKA